MEDINKYKEKTAQQISELSRYHDGEDEGYSIAIPQARYIVSSIIEDCQSKVSREWVYYFCAYINAGHKSITDDKARVEHAIKKLKEKGMLVSDK